MLYDIPHRSGRRRSPPRRWSGLAEHPGIVAVKDAKGDLVAASRVTARTDLAFYSGDDAMTLPQLPIGAVGVVGTSTHFIGAQTKEMILAYERGDHAGGAPPAPPAVAAVHRDLPDAGHDPGQGGPATLGLPAGPVRSPLVDATAAEIAQLRVDAAAAARRCRWAQDTVEFG